MSVQTVVERVVKAWIDAPTLTREYVAEQLGYDLKGRRCVISGAHIIRDVRERMAYYGKHPFDSTILRKLRKLRTLGYDIHCIDNRRSIYEVLI